MAEAGTAAIDLGPLPGLIGYAVRRAQIAIFQDFHRALEPLALRPAAFSVLLVVGRNPGLPQRRIGAALGIHPPNLVALVQALVARGVLDRRANQQDRRSVTLYLTQAGAVLLAEAMVLVDLHERRVTAHLSDGERLRLLALLRQVPADFGDSGSSA